jgi:MoaA/NifB/PqqE/SkfB family radical SAM enzyme
MALEKLPCVKPWTSFRVNDHQGNIKPCCYTPVDFGNINLQSFEEIWNGEAYQALRRSMACGDLAGACPPYCPVLIGEFGEPDFVPASAAAVANLAIQREEIQAGATILRSMPVLLRATPTVRCNLKCKFCFQDHADRVVLPPNIEQILERQFPYLYEFELAGGEPLITSECIRLIQRADPVRYPDLSLGLITNGTAVTEPIVRLLSTRRITWILVSIDAATPETYRKVRGADFGKVLHGVRRLNDIRTQHGKTWDLKINLIVMRSNMHEAPAFVDLARSLDVDFQFSPIIGKWHDEYYYDDPAEVDRARRMVGELERKIGSGDAAARNHGIASVRAYIDHEVEANAAAGIGSSGRCAPYEERLARTR